MLKNRKQCYVEQLLVSKIENVPVCVVTVGGCVGGCVRVAITHCRAGLGPPVAAPGHLFSTSYGPLF